MSAASADPHAINTLGELEDAGMGLAWTYNHCHRTLDEGIRRCGRNQVFAQWMPRIICGSCGSRDISTRGRVKVPGR